MACLEPGTIHKLDETVVNRIAAGEIIQRPANALKELIENSLDAKASYIQIVVKTGGLKQLQIQDNGTGIRHDDLDIVCERFTTSKLNTFDDLKDIATFGFRGEALASISHVAHLTIQTKTRHDRCAYKASYKDGKLEATPKACAGNQGTIITIEDLFYNMPQRQQSSKSPKEEFQKIFDVVSKYAIHNSGISFTLKKFGEQPQLKTQLNCTRIDNIRQIYGLQIAKELLKVEVQDEVYKFTLSALITKVNYSEKKGTILLFINHRLVDSPAIKATVDCVYSTYLAKGTHPFVYISLLLPPNNVDVNVHPTKHEVHFLHENEIVGKIKAHLEAELLGCSATRKYYKQLKLSDTKEETSSQTPAKQNQENKERVYAKDMIRTDAKEQKLDKFLLLPKNEMPRKDIMRSESNSRDKSFHNMTSHRTQEVRLTSVLNMRKRIEQNCSVLLRKTIKNLIFVGVVDETFALFQHETKLYLSNTSMLSEELFYQRLVFDFQNFSYITINPKLSVKSLVRLALNSSESGWTEENGDRDELADRAVNILTEKSAMMSEYFGLRINEQGELETLPALLSKYAPRSAFLPIYMLRLATEVEWETEADCFETFCRETARFYAQISPLKAQENSSHHLSLVEHIIYPSFKQYLLPPNKLKQALYELTTLPNLYKVFERC